MSDVKKLPEEALPETPELREPFLKARAAARKLAAKEAQKGAEAETATKTADDGSDERYEDEHIGDADIDRRLYERRPLPRTFPRGKK